MKKILMLNILFVFVSVYSLNIFAQKQIDENAERYIEINKLEDFFITSNEYPNEIICNFELHNILEGESSKPAFVAVNELSNVTKFSIKARSEKYENQRSCYLRMQNQNYFSTFGLVLNKLEIKHIWFEGNYITTEEFLKKIL
ncbi:MAG: hypothetical protein M0P36_10915 [Bacteroidales bacterium]|nr:hypothetical protein [Bacteroidales bacterium]